MKRISLTLEKKLTFVLVSFFFSMLAVVIIILSSLGNEYERRVYQINSENTRNILSRADSSFSSALLLSDIFIADGFFQDRLSSVKDGNEDFQEVSSLITSRLSTMTDSSSFIVDIALSLPQGIIHSGTGVGLSSEAIDEAASIAREAGGASAWVGSDDGSIYLVRAIRRIEFLSLDELAILFIRIDGTSLVSALRSEMPNAGISLILASGGRLLYSDYPGGTYSGSSISDEIDDVRCFIYRGNLPASGFSYIDFVPSDQIFGNLARFVAGTFSAFLLMLLAFLLVLHYMVRRIIGRVNSLKEKMDAFEAGTYISSGQAHAEGGDEIAQLSQHFDRMVDGYRAVVEDNLHREIMLKDSEIRMLTQQINPHFLYNVLDSIYWLSQKYEADDIAAMSYDLASLFRAAVSAEDLVPIRKELEMLESFLRIQRSRFHDSISYSVDAESCTLEALIPKFSLQPLVENAVKHSVEEHGVTTEISVVCRADDGTILLEVSNTGSQFPDDIVEKLADGRVSSSSERIGLQNIDERLHLLFGEESGLRFRNSGGKAIVSFSVPGRFDAESNPCR